MIDHLRNYVTLKWILEPKGGVNKERKTLEEKRRKY
jgi:hypothetical protein